MDFVFLVFSLSSREARLKLFAVSSDGILNGEQSSQNCFVSILSHGCFPLPDFLTCRGPDAISGQWGEGMTFTARCQKAADVVG